MTGFARPTEAQSRGAIYAATIGNVMEWYDFGVFGFLAGALALNFFPKDDPRISLLNTFLIFGVGLVFRPLGGIVIGRMGDTRGRKPALILTMLMMAAATVIIGVLPAYATIGFWAPVLLLLARLLQGFSTGGEWGGATAFMAEWSMEGKRGLYTSFQQMLVAGGSLLAVGLSAFLTSSIGAEAINNWGWRIPFLLGGPVWPDRALVAAAGCRNATLPGGGCRALSDMVGRKSLLLASCALCFVLPIPAFLVLTGGYGFLSIVAIQILFSLAISLFSGPGPAAIAEIFPTRGRSTWMSASYALAVAIFGGFAPFVSQWLIDATGSKMVPTAYVMAAAAVSFITIAGLRETAHRPLR